MKLGEFMLGVNPGNKVQIRVRKKGGRNSSCYKVGVARDVSLKLSPHDLDWNIYRIKTSGWGFQVYCEV